MPLVMPQQVVLLGKPSSRLLVSEAFLRANAVVLGTSESGHAWTVGNQGDAATLPVWSIVSQQARLTTAGTQNDQHAWVESGASDVLVQANVAVDSAASTVINGLLVRRVDGANWLAARLNNNGDAVALFRSLAGVRSSISSVALAIADGATIALAVLAVGSRIRIYADGVLKVDTTETNFTTATKHGLYNTGGASSGSLDDFKVFAP